MDGSIRINHSEIVPAIRRTDSSAKDGKRKPFDPEATAPEQEARGDNESPRNHDSTPVGPRPDDESGSHLDLTA